MYPNANGYVFFGHSNMNIDQLQMRYRQEPVIDYDAIKRAYPKLAWIQERMSALHAIETFEELDELEDEMDAYASYYDERTKPNFFVHYSRQPARTFSKEFEAIGAQRRAIQIATNPVAAFYYAHPLCTSEDVEVNGYDLYNKNDGEAIMGFYAMENIIRTKCIAAQPTEEEFDQWLKEEVCSDWNKMDDYGNSFGGFWQFPEGSHEKENAYALSGEFNKAALKALPYPYKLLKWTVRIGCNNRQECVRYSNFLCYYVEQTMKRLVGLFSLEDRCRYAANCARLKYLL